MTDINRLKNQARRYEQQEQWQHAIELYSRAIDAIEAQGFGTDLSLYNRVGDLYLRQGDTARAVSFYERAVDRYAEQGLQTSAVALCNKILRIAPGRSEIYRTLGRLHAETGLQSQARRSFMEYASRMEDAGELPAAIEALDEFVKLSADEEARTALGRHLITQQRVEEGVSHLRQVLVERSARGEQSDEIEALIEEVAPGQSDIADQAADDELSPPADESLREDIDESFAEDTEPSPADDHSPPSADSGSDDPSLPLLTDVEAAELDQIIADLGGLDLDPDPGEALDPPSTPYVAEEPLIETLGASITVSDSTLHDLLSEFQAKVVAQVEDTDSAIHYDLGVAYKEMGMLDDAIREFTTAIQNDHGLLGAHQLLTESLIQKGQYDAGVGAMAEYVKAVEPENDVSGQMERVSELLRASPSEDTLSELTQLLRSLGDPASETSGGAPVLDEISVDELFPDLEEAWESTSRDTVTGLEEPEAAEASVEVSTPEGSWDDNAEAGDTEGALVEEAEIPELEELDESELEAALAPVETEEPSASELADEAEPATQAVEEGFESEGLIELVDEELTEEPAVDGPESESETDLGESHEDESALQALSEALGEPLDSWDESGDQATWDPEASLEQDVEVPAWEAESSWQADDEPEAEFVAEVSDEDEPEAEFVAEVSDEDEPEAEFVADVSDEDEPETELVAEMSDEDEPETELVADVSDEDEPEAELVAEVSDEAPPAAEEASEDLGGLLFGARLAKFRARMARSASETDFQAHYDLGLAYKEVALFDEAIAELLVAITGPDTIARKSLRLMSEVAELSNDESLHFTTAEHLHENGMSEEALEHLSHVFDARLASGGDTDEVRRRMSAIDPHYVPASEIDEPDSEDRALVSAGFDSIMDELSGTDAETVAEVPEAEQAAEEAPEAEQAAEEEDLNAWEFRTAELLEQGHRDEAIRELYRLQAAYEAQEDFAGASRAVGNLLLLDPEDVILHHQQVEYAMLLGDNTALTSANLDLGRCLQRQGAETNARAAFEQVLELDPENETAKAAIEALAELDEDDDPVEPDVAEAPTFASDDPVHYETHFELGVAFKQDGLHDEAVYELEIAARGLEDPTPAYELLGELFNEAGQHETTSKVLGRAIEANGRDDSELVGVLYQLGVSHQELGDTDQAAECFRRVLEVAADYRDAGDRLDACSL